MVPEREPLPTRVQDTPSLPAPYADALERGLAGLGLDLDDAARATIDGHVRLLLAWTTAINLTAIREPAAVATGHVVDSLSRRVLAPGTWRRADPGPWVGRRVPGPAHRGGGARRPGDAGRADRQEGRVPAHRGRGDRARGAGGGHRRPRRGAGGGPGAARDLVGRHGARGRLHRGPRRAGLPVARGGRRPRRVETRRPGHASWPGPRARSTPSAAARSRYTTSPWTTSATTGW